MIGISIGFIRRVATESEPPVEYTGAVPTDDSGNVPTDDSGNVPIQG